MLLIERNIHYIDEGTGTQYHMEAHFHRMEAHFHWYHIEAAEGVEHMSQASINK